MSDNHPSYAAARDQLLAYLQTQGFKPHPNEVFCPSADHHWVDVAAVKGPDYWAFEYKSRSDSMRRGFNQCCAYAKGFNYVVLVADRHRVTSSPYFNNFRTHGFGVWRHDRFGFQTILQPKRRATMRRINTVVRRQFGRSLVEDSSLDARLTRWFSDSDQLLVQTRETVSTMFHPSSPEPQ